MKKRYLTKSRYKLASECPTKLFYAGKADEYADSSSGDPFLMELAKGGFQVGELAKLYFEGGYDIVTLDHQQALDETSKLMKNENVIIYEAAISIGNLYVRVDVLVKNGDHIQLVEVKSKSFDPSIENPFYLKSKLKKGNRVLNAEWKPYLYDIAFQSYVFKEAFPKFKVCSYLMLADKSSLSSVDGLNQNFFLYSDENGRTHVQTKNGLKRADLGDKILCKINVDEEVALIHSGEDGEIPRSASGQLSYTDEIEFFARHYVDDKKMITDLGTKCKNCEFREAKAGLKSGFDECWIGKKPTSGESKPFVFDIWNFRKAKELLDSGIYLIDSLTEDDLTIREADMGLSTTERQWLQIEKYQNRDSEPYIDLQGLQSEMISWQFPLHFIDFETTMVAIPFNKGRRPYEQIAFQFSHHMVHRDGTIRHETEYLNRKRGIFPNFDFVRNLKSALSKFPGTIFRYAAHENTVLCQIYAQLKGSNEPDREELCEWIKTVTKSPKKKGPEEWEGERNMVDLCELVKKYYYHPDTAGSNSIKAVLPAILNHSNFLKTKYERAVYGSGKIKSKNFSSYQWVKYDDHGMVVDPYKQLPKIFEGMDIEQLDRLLDGDELADGSAAMTAYAKMQFTEMSEEEVQAISSALLKYCELDTFAMVMIYEYWRELLEGANYKVSA